MGNHGGENSESSVTIKLMTMICYLSFFVEIVSKLRDFLSFKGDAQSFLVPCIDSPNIHLDSAMSSTGRNREFTFDFVTGNSCTKNDMRATSFSGEVFIISVDITSNRESAFCSEFVHFINGDGKTNISRNTGIIIILLVTSRTFDTVSITLSTAGVTSGMAVSNPKSELTQTDGFVSGMFIGVGTNFEFKALSSQILSQFNFVRDISVVLSDTTTIISTG
mmetsp:Transcript_57133/g.65151  ORF Transcript_57133/g.65151 Transcript_57133/m.65151 type:complete len:221 (+) Transcript_57133:189-851(+)